MNSKSSLRAVLRSGLLKEFLERSVGLQKGRAERNLELRWGDDGEGLKEMHSHL